MNPHPPSNFRWIVPRKLAGSGRLTTPDHVSWLHEEGVGAIVSAIPLWDEVVHSIRVAGLEHLELPIEDFGIPTDEQIEKYLAFMDARIAEKKAVLVHCAYGVGRTGTLGALWLVHVGVPAQEALDKVGVESRSQVQLIQRWEERKAPE